MTPRPLDLLSFPLSGMNLIEASAGTGKTYTIAALYVRLVLGHGGEARLPPEVLVVTFTDAATKELAERIRARLRDAAAAFRTGHADERDVFLCSLLNTFPAEQYPDCVSRLELAADWMDEAAVSTIHSWCYRMLREHAFAANSLLELELDQDESELQATAVRDFWRQFFYPLPAGLLLTLLGEKIGTPDDFLKKLGDLLRTPPQTVWQADGSTLAPDAPPLAALQDWQGHLPALEGTARAAWLQHWQDDAAGIVHALTSAIEGKRLNGASYKLANLDADLAALAQWAAGTLALPDKLVQKYSASGFKLNKDKAAPEHKAFAVLDALAAHLQAKPAIPLPQLYAHAADWVRTHIARAKAQRARLGFDDLLLKLYDALHADGGDELAQLIRQQFPVAFIDEFQDTDPIQYAIFRRVYGINTAEPSRAGEGQGVPAANAGIDQLGHSGMSEDTTQPFGCTAGSTFVMIGDPKQAIYAFRGGDIHTYLRARREAGGAPWMLGTNYRSSAAMIAAVNALFAFGEQQDAGAFACGKDDANALPFSPVGHTGRAGELLLDGAPLPAMQCWVGDAVLDNQDDYRQAMSAACANEIARLLTLAAEGRMTLKGRALAAGDIAVLVRSRKEAQVVREKLAALRIGSVFLSDRDSVFASDEAWQLQIWLQAACTPQDERLVRAALATPLLRRGDAEIVRIQSDELAWEEDLERFRLYHQLWQAQGVLPMLTRLIADFALPARLLPLSGGERMLTNVLHLAELLQTAAETLDGEHALLRWLQEHCADADEQGAGNDAHILRLESDAELVQVITIHKSKGLEYPLVFLPCMGGFSEGGKGAARYHHDGQTIVDIQPSDFAKAQRKAAEEQEALRILYVALTRAREACWLGLTPYLHRKAAGLPSSAIGYLLGGKLDSETAVREAIAALGSPDWHCVPLPAPAAPLAAGNTSASPGSVRRFSGRIERDWWIASYSALTSERTQMPQVFNPTDIPRHAVIDELLTESPAAASTQIPSLLREFPRGAAPGTFLHELLEWAANEGFAELADNSDRTRLQVQQFCQRRAMADWGEKLGDWLLGFITHPIALPDAPPLRLAECRELRPEMEFWLPAGYCPTAKLDKSVTTHTLAGIQRPALEPGLLKGMLKGFMDLVLCHAGRYYVLDYKSNHLGDSLADYAPAALQHAIAEHRYELQYTLYLLALHRLLQVRIADYDYDTHIGGAIYLFLRGLNPDDASAGHGVHADKPPRALIEELDGLFASEVSHA
ncbi:UvrD-helicase domain-containing protein [Chitinilyticum litopenaei]|uniref:RecBCD enzyme subunit RecB n=2 Tax=Chitinilyticum piscinae TaxID=2866724 RepID=A0A8J7FZS7_9NEIS|nr:UvrD-helicase domain-containing protein [Chitinilyticum piscinae]